MSFFPLEKASASQKPLCPPRGIPRGRLELRARPFQRGSPHSQNAALLAPSPLHAANNGLIHSAFFWASRGPGPSFHRVAIIFLSSVGLSTPIRWFFSGRIYMNHSGGS